MRRVGLCSRKGWPHQSRREHLININFRFKNNIFFFSLSVSYLLPPQFIFLSSNYVLSITYQSINLSIHIDISYSSTQTPARTPGQPRSPQMRPTRGPSTIPPRLPRPLMRLVTPAPSARPPRSPT